MKPWLIPVGGFLGSGKTSLLLAAGQRLRARGVKVAILTNDQAAGLVDTVTARNQDFDAGEVAGACFCCAFTKFVDAAAELAGRGARTDRLTPCEPGSIQGCRSEESVARVSPDGRSQSGVTKHKTETERLLALAND